MLPPHDLEISTASYGRSSRRDDAAIFLKEGIDTDPHEFGSKRATDLIKKIVQSYAQTGPVGELQRAIQYAEKPATGEPVTHPQNATCLSRQANLLVSKFERTGEIRDLQSAILRAEEALDATPRDHPDRPGRLSNLGNCLGRRYEQTGAMEDLESAIWQCAKAVELTPSHHPWAASRLSSLGNWIARKYERTNDFTYLEEAIGRTDEALAATPPRHPDRASYLNSLGNMLARKYSHTHNLTDILLALFLVEEALRLTPAVSPERTKWLNNLTTIMAWKFRHTSSLDDLDYAIRRAGEALVSMPADHPHQVLSLISYGDLLYCRYDRRDEMDLQKPVDYDGCLSHYLQAWNRNKSPPAQRIRAGKRAAELLFRSGKWEESSDLLYDAVQLLPGVIPHNLKQQDRQYMLRELSGLATTAASAALAAGREPIWTLQLLEQGRGVGAGLRFGIRPSEFAALRIRHPDMADKLERLYHFLQSSKSLPRPYGLDGANGGDTVQVMRTSERYQAAAQFDAVVDEVRKLPGLESFMLPPTAKELHSAGSSGPLIIINVSPFRSDALLVTKDSVRSLRLPGLDYADVVKKVDIFRAACASDMPSHDTEDISKVLEWLWDVVASPILNELGFREAPRDGDTWPRVWWIPTGLLSMLPLHAAGRHRSALSQTVIDRVVSSYSPSVRSLLRTQRQVARRGRRGEALLVSMETTPRCSPLPTARKETESVGDLLQTLGVGVVHKKDSPSKADVIDGLKTCDVFHFAGHGIADPVDPSNSSLLLNDWQSDPLTVESIMDLNLVENAPWLAYLSACSTGAHPAERLHDEYINLMSACQQAGFRHTVGSLWDLSASYPPIAAAQFYGTLGDGRVIDDSAVAWAVHSAARHIREVTRGPESASRGEGDILAWAAYVHIGPYVTTVGTSGLRF